jgi:hypothetical protein
MHPRHAAALALVGWYLMVPPVIHEEDWQQQHVHPTTAPLSEWFTWNSFDTADACTKARSALIASGVDGVVNDYNRWLDGRASSEDLLDEWANTYSISSAIMDADGQSLCIATDDPRLKEK